jgi:aryl-alcohol dehydrogenase-like predicted oxidoreductase
MEERRKTMQYTNFGKTGLVVSQFSFGAMTFGQGSLVGGFLTGKYTPENPAPDNSRRAKFDFPPIDVQKGYEVVAKLKEIGEKCHASIPQVALAWLLGKPFVSTVLVGATKLDQLEDNLGAAELILSAEDFRALDELTTPSIPYPAWMQGMGWDEQVKEALGEN